MLTVACVEHGNYEGHGLEYVARLRASVARNLKMPHRFVVLTDRPGLYRDHDAILLPLGLSGWWNKLALFRPGMFEGRVVYLDLDVAIVGPLDGLAERKGTIHLKDWGWAKNDYGSGLMVWDAGEHSDAWERRLNEPGPAWERFKGDQDWLTHLGGWDAVAFPAACSYRYHCKDGPPAGASVVLFHGRPKANDLPAGHWIHQYWKL